ncbi:MAG: aminoglycoside 3'-phosphotransferase [Oscillospiraceae bacterium]|jgi:kanamycin kinase|nr:aminoglycoside 3'-phosphotransferase [Oscillospiraceae bacterium]
MRLTPTTVALGEYPAQLHPFLRGAALYDSSSSPNAKVLFIDKDGGYFLKIGRVADLDREYEMTRYFHSKGLAPGVVAYLFDIGHDYLLTEKAPGEDGVAAKYLAQPKKLAELLGERLALLHSLDPAGCPVPNHTERYLFRAEQNYRAGICDQRYFSDNWGYASADEAWRVVEKHGKRLKTDTLLHGDYCLPNIILNDWRFSAFVDLDGGGVGDRHIDLFWGAWTLAFNLKTDQYRSRFLDAYGRGSVDEEMLRVVAACEVFD